MASLRIAYLDSDGRQKIAEIDRSPFILGRHSECNLSIADSRLSRKHAKIDRIGDFFVLSDLGSSNGTFINGKRLSEPVTITDGDMISLGGLELEAAIDDARNTANRPEEAGNSAVSTESAAGLVKQPESKNKFPVWLIIAGPAAAAVLVVLAGVIIFFAVSRNSTAADVLTTDDNVDISENDDARASRKSKDTATEPDKNSGQDNASRADSPAVSSSPDLTSPAPTATPDTEQAKVEANAAKFLRRIAQNDPKAFLTTEQAKIVLSKTKEFAGSKAMAENITSARKNASQIRSLAAAKNVKPLFLAVAAMTKLGNSRGDVLATAQSMADTLDKLTIQLGNELADDCLLTIAAYDQGAAGDTMKLRNQLQKLATDFPQSSREIRTIWFLRKQGTITPTEFDMALRFLAIGTITQNPAAFGVNAEALDF